VLVHGQGVFDAFPPEQERSAAKLLAALALRFGWTRAVSVYGHRDFDSPRKEDPGPLWAGSVLPRVLDAVFGAPAVTAAEHPPARAQGG
jgi:N-acetyl-anhydromuramyl-L-alanine amidase AmpD